VLGTTQPKLPSPVRDGRQFLSSLTGLTTISNREPSHKWLGYFQRRVAKSPYPNLSTDNSPAFQGWVKSQLKFISPVRDERTFAPSHQLLRNLLVEDFLSGQSMPLSLTGTSLGMPPRAMPAQFSNSGF